MRKPFHLILAAMQLIVVCGCQTTHKQEQLTTVTVSDPIEIAPPQPLLPAPGVSLSAVPTAEYFRQTPWPTNWVNTWIPLELWAKYNGLTPPAQMGPAAPGPTFEVPTTNGPISIKIGSRISYLGGIQCWLGYAPQIIKGIPCVYWLDAQKTLQPFLGMNRKFIARNRIIVIDPGHGGKDSGAKSVIADEYEKDYTLDWALRLRTLLVTNGWTVHLTRTNDVEVSLAERVAIADRVKAELFISLHFNSGLPNRELSGVETYCLTSRGLPSTLLRNYQDEIRQEFPNNAFDEANFQLAMRVHGEILRNAGLSDRGVRRARFMAVLRGQSRPAVLLEAGYLSSSLDAAALRKPKYLEQLAKAVFDTLQ